MTLGRPLGYDPDRALDAAMQLFWSRGYEATSLQELMAAMGLSKSSLYQAFGGKKELFLRCIDRYRDKVGGALAELFARSGSGREFLEQLLVNAADEARHPNELRRGCLLMNTATECAPKDAEIAGQVASGLDGLRGLLEKAVQRGQAEGEIGAELDPAVVANYLLSTLAGIKTVVKGGADQRQVRDIVAITLRVLG